MGMILQYTDSTPKALFCWFFVFSSIWQALILCRCVCQVNSTASTSAPAASSTTSTPSFGRHVILQVSPAMSFGPFSHVAVIPANLRLALQRVAAGQSPAGSSSSDTPAQSTQQNSESNAENGNNAQDRSSQEWSCRCVHLFCFKRGLCIESTPYV